MLTIGLVNSPTFTSPLSHPVLLHLNISSCLQLNPTDCPGWVVLPLIFKWAILMVQTPMAIISLLIRLFKKGVILWSLWPGVKTISLQERIAMLDTSGALCGLGLKGEDRSSLTKETWLSKGGWQSRDKSVAWVVPDCFSSREQE